MQQNVKEILEEMKDLSELMLDLGYSSVFFKSKDIANEVYLLDERLKELEQNLYMHLFAASRGGTQEKLVGIIEIVESARFVGRAAKNLSEIVVKGMQLHPVVKEALEHTDEHITRATVGNGSVIAHKTLGDTKLGSELAIRIVAIRRAGKWIFNPNSSTETKPNDILIVVGTKVGCSKVRRIAKGPRS